jgi:predicted PurR-regulated permease PerM
MDGASELSLAAIAERPSREPLRSKFTAALFAASAMVALYVGRPVLVPFSLALLVTFALAPVIDALCALKVKLLPAVLATVALAAALLASIALFLAGQFEALAGAETGPVHLAASLVEPLLNPLTSAGAAVVIAAFLLLHRDKLVHHLAGARAAEMEAASRDFGRYLLTQGVLDLAFGVVVALGLWTIGAASFGLWALLGVMLRSVPFVGVAVAALCPTLLGGDPTAAGAGVTLVLFLAADGALRIVERRWLKRTAPRLSACAAVSATVLWTCVWGLTGLLLAIPLTLGTAMLGRRFGPLRVLDRLLAPDSREPSTRWPADADSGDAVLIAVPPEDPAPLAPDWRNDCVLCVAGPGFMDEAAAGLLAETLKRSGIGARVVRFAETAHASLPRLECAQARVACFCSLDAHDAPVLRGLVRRMRPRLRGATAIAGLWGWDGGALMDAGTVECDLIATRLQEAADRIVSLARRAERASAKAAA